MAMNSLSTNRAGTFCTPLVDCTKTPTKEHFDLGTREHKLSKRSAYQAKFAARAKLHKDESAPIWRPD